MNLPRLGRISPALLLAGALPLPAAFAQNSQDSLRRLIEESLTATRHGKYSKGSLYTDRSYLSELGRDPKAAVVGDLVTIRVLEQASALTTGVSSSSRSSGEEQLDQFVVRSPQYGRRVSEPGPIDRSKHAGRAGYHEPPYQRHRDHYRACHARDAER